MNVEEVTELHQPKTNDSVWDEYVNLPRNLLSGLWKSDLRLVAVDECQTPKLSRVANKRLDSIRQWGRRIRGQLHISPEWALHLVESNRMRLAVTENSGCDGDTTTVPSRRYISVQESYSLILTTASEMEGFRIFSHLARLGFRPVPPDADQGRQVEATTTVERGSSDAGSVECIDLSSDTSSTIQSEEESHSSDDDEIQVVAEIRVASPAADDCFQFSQSAFDELPNLADEMRADELISADRIHLLPLSIQSSIKRRLAGTDLSNGGKSSKKAKQAHMSEADMLAALDLGRLHDDSGLSSDDGSVANPVIYEAFRPNQGGRRDSLGPLVRVAKFPSSPSGVAIMSEVRHILNAYWNVWYADDAVPLIFAKVSAAQVVQFFSFGIHATMDDFIDED